MQYYYLYITDFFSYIDHVKYIHTVITLNITFSITLVT